MNEKNNENRNGRKILPFSWEYGQEEITLKVSSYAYGNGLAILMYRQEEGELELFDDLTVNLPGGYGLKPQEAFISGDLRRTSWHSSKRTGWETYCRDRPGQALLPTPQWRLTLQGLPSMTREGVEEFCRQWGLDVPKEPGKNPRETCRQQEKRKREIKIYGSKNE